MTAVPRRRIVTMLAACLLLPVTGALVACDPDQVGAAAILDGEPIPVEQLQKVTREYLEFAPSADKTEAQHQILNRLIASKVIERAARRADVSVARGEAAAELDAILEQVGSRKQLVQALAQNREILPPSHIDQWSRDRLLVNKLVQKVAGERDQNSPEVGEEVRRAFVSAARAMRIEVNPRYGRWSSNQLTLSPLVGGGLSKPVAELTGRRRPAGPAGPPTSQDQ